MAGRPLEIDVCDDGGTPDGALACGRDFVDDESLVASVGVDSVPDRITATSWATPGVAIIGAVPSSTWEISAPTSFPFIGGTLAYYQALAAVGKGYEKVALIRIDIAQSAVIAALFETLGLEVVADVAVPATATDGRLRCTQALKSGADAVVLALAEPGLSLVIQGIYQQAEDSVAILTTGEQFDADAMAALGDASSILYGVLGLPPASAAADHESVRALPRRHGGLRRR